MGKGSGREAGIRSPRDNAEKVEHREINDSVTESVEVNGDTKEVAFSRALENIRQLTSAVVLFISQKESGHNS